MKKMSSKEAKINEDNKKKCVLCECVCGCHMWRWFFDAAAHLMQFAPFRSSAVLYGRFFPLLARNRQTVISFNSIASPTSLDSNAVQL